ncbi:MAG: hypothetical protein AAGH60_15185 [Pseudomonadota bacterium]
MDASPTASTAMIQGRQNVATAVVQQAVKADQQQAQAINAMIANSAETVQPTSGTADGVGTRVDRSV